MFVYIVSKSKIMDHLSTEQFFLTSRQSDYYLFVFQPDDHIHDNNNLNNIY